MKIDSKDNRIIINDTPRTFGYVDPINIAGEITLGNTVITNGMATTLYTGNGTTQSVVTGVDMATQWGNLASETFGGLVWHKNRGGIANHILNDTVRGVTKVVSSSLTDAESTNDSITAFSSTGFTIGTVDNINANTYASWNFQTTHRTSGTTNHGKAYTCHYNPFTGFTIVKYEGSGLAGHEIPHHLGRKLGFVTTKNLSAVTDWVTQYVDGKYLFLNKTDAESVGANAWNETSVIQASGTSNYNASVNNYIMYGWANSYFDEANTLIGNYEIGIYQGTGAAGNKVQTRGKPAWVMTKRLDSTGNWNIFDNQRDTVFPNTSVLWTNLNNAESTSGAELYFYSDSFLVNSAVSAETNTSGGQYLYMAVYDNDSGSGKSKYPRATDTSNININALVPLANGIDSLGNIQNSLLKEETISGLTLSAGNNYIYLKSDGTYGSSRFEPQYSVLNNYNGFGEVFDVSKNTWYNSPSVFSDDFLTDTSKWAADDGATLSISGDYIKIFNTITGYGSANGLDFPTVIGKKYKITYSFSAMNTVGYIWVYSNPSYQQLVSASTSVTNATVTFIAHGSISRLKIGNLENTLGDYSLWNNISVTPLNPDGSVDLTDATPISESRNYLNAVVLADTQGQPVSIKQLPKYQIEDIIDAEEVQAKNTPTAWVNFDGTTTPCTIRDSYNVKAVIRTATGLFDIYFEDEMQNSNYSVNYTTTYDSKITAKSNQKVSVACLISTTEVLTNYADNDITIIGGL